VAGIEADLRREILVVWRRFEQGKRGETREDELGNRGRRLRVPFGLWSEGKREGIMGGFLYGRGGNRWIRRCQQVGPVGQREREKGDAGLGWFGCWVGGSGSAQLGWFLFFLFFSVSVFFLSFANWLQTDSNNYVNFSKIQSINVGQSKTGFQNKIRFSIKPYKF
jgi:hypothetical protein